MEQFYSERLPNLGNTCYLNCIIQFLYSSQLFRHRLEQNVCKDKGQTLTYHLNNIFEDIGRKSSIRTKQKLMRKLLQKIESMDQDIKCHAQQDFLQILMMILSQLFEQNQRMEDLFTIQTQNTCECGSFKTVSMLLPNQIQICISCHNFIDIKLLNKSQLLILSKTMQSNPQAYNNLYFESNNSKLAYQCIAKIFYFGNSYCGHYRASRLCNNKFIEFSDLNVYNESDKHPSYLLYQRKDQIAENSPVTLGQLYRSQLYLIDEIKPTNNQIKSLKFVYLQFKEFQIQNGFQLQMHVLNQEQFGMKNYKITKRYSRKGMKTPQLYISIFLKRYEEVVNIKLTHLLQGFNLENKAIFLKRNHETFLRQNDKYKNEPFIDVTRSS